MKLGFKLNFNDKLPKDKAEEIENVFKDQAELFLKELTGKQIDLFLSESWTDHIKKYGYNTPHDHSGSNVIGVYYVKAQDNCGDLLLHDPRGATNFISQYDINTEGYLVSGRSYYRVKPKVGNLILFPSYVVHSVQPNMNDETRLSLAMNFKYKDYKQFKPD